MRLHHHVKRGVGRLVSLAKGRIRIALLFIVFVGISYFAVSSFIHRGFTQSATPQQVLGESTLAALNLHPLANDEFAIISKSTGKPVGKKVTQTIQLSSGETYTMEVDQNTTVNVVEGNDKTVNYIKMAEGVEIHKKNEVKRLRLRG